jgi:hypothetical protein
MHLLGRCSALGPGPGSLPRPSSSPSSRTRPCALFAPHLVPCGTAWHFGSPGVLRRGVGVPSGGLYFIYFLGETTNKFEGNTITFLISRTTPRGFFAILTTHRRNFFSTSEGLLRPGARSFGVNRAHGLSIRKTPATKKPRAAKSSKQQAATSNKEQGTRNTNSE